VTIGFTRGRFADVEYILENLSEVSAAEMMAFELTNWDMMHRARQCMKTGGLDCIIENGKPLAVIGSIYEKDPYIHRTWFIATQQYFDMGVKAVLASRRYMTTLAKSRPGVCFQAFTGSPHPQVERWFALLGFQKIQELDGFALYEFEGIRRSAA
jgi:hypothetical protein